MKNIFKNTANLLVATALLAAGSVSCEKFLEETNYSSAETAETYFTQDNAEQLITAAYIQFRSVGPNASYSGTDLYSVSADLTYTNSNNEYNTLLMSDAGGWSGLYTQTSRCNVALNRIENQISWDNTTSYQTKKAELVAHAKMLRGYAYYKLLCNYGDVPIIVEEVSNITYNYPRDPEEEVMEQVLKDVLEAVEDLPETTSSYFTNKFYFTKRAAYHVLADIYTTKGGKSYGSSADYTTAIAYANKAIDSYDLCSQTYAELFDFDNQDNAEVLLALRYDGTYSSTAAADYKSVWYKLFKSTLYNYEGLERLNNYAYATSTSVPTNYFYELLLKDSDDARDATIIHRVLYAEKEETKTSLDGNRTHTLQVGDTVIYFPKTQLEDADKMDRMSRYYVFDDPYYYYSVTGSDYDKDPNSEGSIFAYNNNGNSINANFPIFKKFDDAYAAKSYGETYGSRDVFVIRLAETHLIAAEAAVRAGDNATALTHINKVHQRASGNASYYSGTVTLDDVLDERGIELAGEENRWYILCRTGKLKERCELYNDHIVDHAVGNIDEAIHCLRMIDEDTIEDSQGSITQNYGYVGYVE